MELMSQSVNDDPPPPPTDAIAVADATEVAAVAAPAEAIADPQDREDMLRDAELSQAIYDVLRSRVREAEIDDVRQEVLMAAYDSPTLPKDPDARRKYVLGIARVCGANHRRKERRSPVELEGKDTKYVAQAVPADPIAERDMLAKIVGFVTGDDLLTLKCLVRTAFGEDLTKIALEVGVKYDTLAKRVATLRRRMRETAKQMGGVVLLLLGIGGFWKAQHPAPQLGLDGPVSMHTIEPAVSVHIGDADPVDVATAIRGRAFKACMRDNWESCLADLDFARDIDPAGDNDPLVDAARDDAAKGIHAREVDKRRNAVPSDKPSFPSWTPPTIRLYAGHAAR